MIDVKAKIVSFFVFNSNFCQHEDEELKKLLFFYPSHIEPETRKMQVGLCEAVIKFMSTFSSESCEALQTQTKRHIFYQPEKDYWMILIVKIPYATKTINTGNNIETVQPSIMSDFLVSAYRRFTLFNGCFESIPTEELYSKCERFFASYISQKTITNDITDIIQGISYLPLDKTLFFKVICFIDLVEVNYPSFKCVMFLYNDHLIWNELSSKDSLTLYQYLTQALLPEHVEKEIQGGAVASAQRHGRFICPPGGIKSDNDLRNLQKVHVTRETDSEISQCYLVVYRTLSATICFTIDEKEPLNLEEFRALDAFVGPQLSTMASSIGEICAIQVNQNVQSPNSESPKYVYFNRLNKAIKTSFSLNKLVPSTSLKPEVLSIIAGIHTDRKSLGNFGEIIIKTTDDFWITGKSSNEREFFVIIHEKCANLKDIADEVKRVCDTHLKGIFFYPI